MRDVLGPNTHLGYCTNVHAGASLEQTLANLQRHAVAVKHRVSPNAPMGIGLWLSAQAVRQITADDRIAELRDWLNERGLYVFTLNGFPYGDFHDHTVKHAVYRPAWNEPERSRYTWQLARILAQLLPEEGAGSISTLPVGWGAAFADDDDAKRAAGEQLTELVHQLARLELDTGKHIHVDLEPEPGCVFDTSEGAVRFFERYLLGTPDDLSVRSYLRICHDVCHAAVMGEDQAAAFQQYRDAGLAVGKVQLSSALRVPFETMQADERTVALDELRGFAEGRYLHQTVTSQGNDTAFYEDLPAALSAADAGNGPAGEWRVHFHVPLHLQRIGALQTTRDHVQAALAAARRAEVAHFEVETYAWNVLPDALQPHELADGLAQEMQWVMQQSPAEARP